MNQFYTSLYRGDALRLEYPNIQVRRCTIIDSGREEEYGSKGIKVPWQNCPQGHMIVRVKLEMNSDPINLLFDPSQAGEISEYIGNHGDLDMKAAKIIFHGGIIARLDIYNETRITKCQANIPGIYAGDGLDQTIEDEPDTSTAQAGSLQEAPRRKYSNYRGPRRNIWEIAAGLDDTIGTESPVLKIRDDAPSLSPEKLNRALWDALCGR